jgi:streptogramin lyase
VYYASIPDAQPSGNSIATIDPTTGQVSYSAPIGSEPNALAVAPDGSVLYVGLDGTGELARLALPRMTELGRVTLVSHPIFGQSHAETIAVSATDATVAAVSMAWPLGTSPRHAGVASLRDMAMQPAFQGTTSNLIAFDAMGAKLYGLNIETSESLLTRMQVLANGLTKEGAIYATNNFGPQVITFSKNRVIAGRTLYDAPALTTAGVVSGASDCFPLRSGALLLCLVFPDITPQSHILVADPNTFVTLASLLFGLDEPIFAPRRLVEGPAGQVAVSYAAGFFPSSSKVRLFSSSHLLSPPNPGPATWVTTSTSTQDGQALDVGITHNALLFDSARNVYYASIPGSVIGSGNTIATLDPVTGQIAYSSPIGSEPSAIALANDSSALYVGLDGSGEVVKLALPSMTERSRIRLPTDLTSGQSRALAIAVFRSDPSVAAVGLTFPFGTALIRDMVLKPRAASFITSRLLAFDAAGGTLYGHDGFNLHRMQVLADGLSEQASKSAGQPNSLEFAHDAERGGASLLLCLSFSVDQFRGQVPGHLLLADPSTFVIGQSLLFSDSEPPSAIRKLIQGPAGQVAISYPASIAPAPSVRFFTSAQLP